MEENNNNEVRPDAVIDPYTPTPVTPVEKKSSVSGEEVINPVDPETTVSNINQLPPLPEIGSASPKQEEVKKSKTPIIIVIVVVVLLAIIAFLVFYLIPNLKNKQNNVETPVDNTPIVDNEVKISRFKADIYAFINETYDSINNNYRAQFQFNDLDVEGEIVLNDGVESVVLGSEFNATIQLTTPSPIKNGMTFKVHTGESRIALGIVTEVLD